MSRMNRPSQSAPLSEFSGRSIARVLAMQALVSLDSFGATFERDVDAFLRDVTLHHELGLEQRPSEETLRFARRLVLGTVEHRTAIDAYLAKMSTDWPVHRMPPVDRNILRLGVYELLEEPETAAAVIIDETVRIARVFGDVDSPRFVNALLDGIRRELGLPGGRAEQKTAGDSAAALRAADGAAQSDPSGGG